MEGFAKNCGKQNERGAGVRERLWSQLAKFCMNLVSTLKSNLQCEYTHTIRRLEVLYVQRIENRGFVLKGIGGDFVHIIKGVYLTTSWVNGMPCCTDFAYKQHRF